MSSISKRWLIFSCSFVFCPWNIFFVNVILLQANFSISVSRLFFYWSLSDSKSPQISKTLLSILVHLNAVVCMVLAYPLIFNSSSSLTKPSGPFQVHQLRVISLLFSCFIVFYFSGQVKVWFGLIWFNGISNILGHLMPNPFYTYILNI